MVNGAVEVGVGWLAGNGYGYLGAVPTTYVRGVGWHPICLNDVAIGVGLAKNNTLPGTGRPEHSIFVPQNQTCP